MQFMMILGLGIIKPLEMRKFIVKSRQSLVNSDTSVVQVWKNMLVGV
jgi:hypothetical protein